MRSMAKSGPAPLIDEMDYVPRNLRQVRQIRNALIETAGSSRHEAACLVDWLVHRESEASDGPQSPSEMVRASNYRKILARLDGPPWDREPNRDMGAKLNSVEAAHRRKRAAPPGQPFELKAAA